MRIFIIIKSKTWSHASILPKWTLSTVFSGLTSASLRTWVAGLQRELPNPACWQGTADTASGQTAQPCQTAATVPPRPLCQPMGGSLRKIEHTYLTAHPDSCTVVLFWYGLNMTALWSSEIALWHASLVECKREIFGAKTVYLLRKVRSVRPH